MHRVKISLNTICYFISLFILLFSYRNSFAEIVEQNLTTSDSIPFNNIKSNEQPDTFRNPFVKMYGLKADSIQSTSIPTNPKKQKIKKVDTTYYSPKKAALWALACPGLGQIYNKKYWKLPIVYGVLGTVSYFVASNSIKLKQFNGYIRNYYNDIPNPAPYDRLGISEIETLRNSYRRNVQIASFGTVLAWGLSIVDATVDAHMRSFDVSDKLTIKLKPQLNYSNFTYYAGISVNLHLK